MDGGCVLGPDEHPANKAMARNATDQRTEERTEKEGKSRVAHPLA